MQSARSRLQPPSLEHWLGTDSRSHIFSAPVRHRISLLIVVVVVSRRVRHFCRAHPYAGGLVDEALMRLPRCSSPFQRSSSPWPSRARSARADNAIIALAAVTWAIYARLARGSDPHPPTSRVRGGGARYRSIAASDHPSPPPSECRRAPQVQASFDMGSVIIAAAGLSFIGFGAQPPTPEWGVMISEGRNFISTEPWLSLFPGVAILLAVVRSIFSATDCAMRSTAAQPRGLNTHDRARPFVRRLARSEC